MKTICPMELGALLEKGDPIEILDIRPWPRFDFGHIPGSRWLPVSGMLPEVILLSRELLATEPVYLLSETGALAQVSAKDLERRGVSNLIVLTGGIKAWQAEGFPVTGTPSVLSPQGASA